jgi:hypothetical protein
MTTKAVPPPPEPTLPVPPLGIGEINSKCQPAAEGVEVASDAPVTLVDNGNASTVVELKPQPAMPDQRSMKSVSLSAACLMIFMMASPPFGAFVANFIAWRHFHAAEISRSESPSGDESAKPSSERGASDAIRIGEYMHGFATWFFIASAPASLLMLVLFHWKHDRQIPRVCICLLVATGGVFCLASWLLASWCLLGIGQSIVAGAHIVTIEIELWRTVSENIASPPLCAGRSPADAKADQP